MSEKDQHTDLSDEELWEKVKAIVERFLDENLERIITEKLAQYFPDEEYYRAKERELLERALKVEEEIRILRETEEAMFEAFKKRFEEQESETGDSNTSDEKSESL